MGGGAWVRGRDAEEVTDPAIFEDAFNLLCHNKLGSGIHRDVFECRVNDKLVVKVENDLPWRYFGH